MRHGARTHPLLFSRVLSNTAFRRVPSGATPAVFKHPSSALAGDVPTSQLLELRNAINTAIIECCYDTCERFGTVPSTQ